MAAPGKLALLVIDAQVALLDPRHAYRADAVVEAIEALLRAARRHGIPRIFVQHDGKRGAWIHEPGWEIHPRLQPQPDEPVIHKRASDSFYETALEAELRSRGVDRLIVVGCQTPYCVDTTSRRAVSLGFNVWLVEDAHTTDDQGLLSPEAIIRHHNFVLDGFGTERASIAVLSSDEVLKRLTSGAGDASPKTFTRGDET
ncbi:MAG: cysteine hydrolase family protein [Firmicutes bacterium]|nr:cysteine hydrolase family protein [Bacillota bacterium]